MNKDNIYFENIDYFTNTLKKIALGEFPMHRTHTLGNFYTKFMRHRKEKSKGVQCIVRSPLFKNSNQ